MTQLSEKPSALGAVPSASFDVPERPTLSAHVQLVGELRGTGFRERQWLIQRNGRFLQVTELLYRVADHADGRRTVDEISAGVSESTDRLVSPDQVREML